MPNLRSRSAKYRVTFTPPSWLPLICAVLPEDPRGRPRWKWRRRSLRARFEEQFWCEDLSPMLWHSMGRSGLAVSAHRTRVTVYIRASRPQSARGELPKRCSSRSHSAAGACARSRPAGRVTIHSHITMDRYGRTTTRSLRAGSQIRTQGTRGPDIYGLLDLSSMVDLHRLPELFCGIDRRAGEGPTLYPVACSRRPGRQPLHF